MALEKNRVRVRIFNEEYILKGLGNEEYLRKLARYVDRTMNEVKSNNPKLMTAQVAVLAALNIADRYFAAGWEEKEREKGDKAEGEVRREKGE
ncbi:MAG: cell division protein ZapA [bacterium]|jgi:cell division protein ZapA